MPDAELPHPKPRPLASSISELVGTDGGTDLHTEDSRSGASLQHVERGGARLVLKTFVPADDWLMRVAGDTECWNVRAWASGLMDEIPASMDHAIVGGAIERDGDGSVARAALLMRDVGEWVVPDGDMALGVDEHLSFIGRMAELHASFWGWHDDIGLTPLANRYLFLSPAAASQELAIGTDSPVPALVLEGWKRFADESPEAFAVVEPLLGDVDPFLAAIAMTPFTLLHGDWKATNLGHTPDGRTLLLDWAFPGAGPPCSELTWYLAINAARLPIGREATIEAYRTGLEDRGVATDPWWDTQLALAFIGTSIQFGWEKALGGGDEFAWWTDRVLEASSVLERLR